ncbi:MAG: DUF4347 domain-containing protein [Myxococcota bacterium]|nr:DUF4347 domain-containing protein [Myxococcota bacterium]
MGLLRRRPRTVGGRSRRSLVEVVEPRILLSADLPGPDLLPGPAADEVRVDAPASEALAAIDQHALRREIVFVDAGVEGADTLLAGLLEVAGQDRELEVIQLDGGRDGIAQIGEALAGRSGSVDAVHIVSHGTDAGLQLGATWLTGENLESHVGALAAWSEALAGDADLLLYGCDLAGSSEGQALVETLGLLTGADVAASVDPTGAAALGGDWDLEYTRGSVETRLAFGAVARQTWSSTLAPVDLTLHLATRNDVTGGGQPGNDDFSEGDLIAIGDPNLDLGPGTTNGTFSIGIDVDAFAPGIDLGAAHVVSRNVTIGSPGFQLLAGDLLFTAKASSTTFTSNNTTPRDPGFEAEVVATKFDLVAYRPDTPGDYSTGSFALLLEDVSGDMKSLRSITLVEQATSVGGTMLEAGDFLFTRSGSSENHDIYVYETGSVGAGSAPDGRPVLLAGEDAQVGIHQQIRGLELLEEDSSIGGQTLAAGTLLVSVDTAEPVGSNGLPVDGFDVFALDVAQSTLAAGAGNGSASATMLFDGSQVGFNSDDETLDAVMLRPTGGVITAHYLDRFDFPFSYAGDDGSLSWSNDWQEFGDAFGPAGGLVYVADTFFGDGGFNVELGLSSDGGVWREADLSSAASATLSFDYARFALEANDHLVVYAQSSSVGGGVAVTGAPGTWHEIARYSGPASDTSYQSDSIDISAFIASDTRIMFAAENAAGFDDRIWVDDVRIDLAGTATSVNNAPAGADNTVVTAEDTPFVFQLADFGFSDPNGDSLQAVVVTTAPGAGTLRDGATVLTGGETVSAASIAAGDLVFTAAPGESGTGYASFTFQVQDDGGTAGGGVDTDPTANTMTVDVAAPGGAMLWFSTDEDVSGSGAPGLDSWDDGAVLQFDPTSLGGTTAGSFSKRFDLDLLAADGNADVDALHYVRSAITVGGANAIQLLPGDVILSTVADETLLGTSITDGDVVVFRPSASDYSTGSVFVLLDIPGIFDVKGIALVEQDTTIGGVDLAAGSFLFSYLGARNVYHYTADDVGAGTTTGASSLLIDADAIGLSSTNAIRDFTLISSPTTIGGVVLSPGQLLISTDENDTVGGIPTTAHQIITLDVTSAGPGTLASASVLFDGPQVGIESGDEKIFPFTLVAGNAAPVLSPSGPALTPITEDDTANPGDLVSDLLVSSVTDADAGALQGIAITALASGDGTWEFSTDGGGSWAAVGVVSDSSALLLRATDRVRFVPDGEGADSASFDFHAWDQTIGEPGTLFDVTLTGGSTAFSDDVDTATITVAAVNDAPSGADNTVVTAEETAYVFQLADFGFSDPVEGDAFQAVVISTAPGAGTLRDGATVLTGGETVSAASIAAGNLVFTPAPEQSGTGYASFSFQVQDGGGTANGGVDTDPTANTMAIDVTAVNDAPSGADNTVVTAEDTAYVFQLADFGFSDPVEGDAFQAVVITTAPGAGTLRDGATVLTGGETVSAASIAAGNLVFTPAAEQSGTGYASFSFQVQDDGGTANGGVDTDPTANTMTIDVTPANDAPVLTPGAPILAPITEDDTNEPGERVSDIVGASISDGDAGASEGVAVTMLSGANGTWEYSTNGGATWNAIGPVADSSALLLRDTDRLRFVPDGQNGGSASFGFRAWDRTSGAVGTKVDASVAGGDSAFSAASDAASIDVTPVNDAPALGDAVLPGVAADVVDPPGESVGSLFGGLVSDVDAGSSLGGVAVVGNGANPATEGVWQYSSDGGTSWFGVGSVGDGANALAIDAGARLRFVPTSGFAGVPTALVVRALDDTHASYSFTVGGSEVRVNVDTSFNGGPSAIAAAVSTLSTDITAAGGLPLNPGLALAEPAGEGAEPSPGATSGSGEEDLPPTVGSSTPPGQDGPGLLSGVDDGVPPAFAEPPVGEAAARALASATLPGTTLSENGDRDLARRRYARAMLAEPTDRGLFRNVVSRDLGFLQSASEFLRDLDRVRGEAEAQTLLQQTLVGTSAVLSAGLSIGYLIWLTRGGLLVASLASSIPFWRLVDPIPVLASLGVAEEEDPQEEESLASLVGEGDSGAGPCAG